jgi:TusA-related sulfurtransferase
MNTSETNIILEDVRGQICPSCLLVALRHLNANKDRIKKEGSEFHILTDNRHSTTTIPNAVSNMGYDIDVCKEEGYYRIVIKSSKSTANR